MAPKGRSHRQTAARRRAAAASDPERIFIEDAQVLPVAGDMGVREYAHKSGCSEQTAHRRLVRLVDAGYAERSKQPGHGNAYRYTLTVEPA